MAYYRLYKLAADGRIIGVEECHADNDEGAIAAAIQLAYSHAVAIWQEQRFLGTLDPGHATLRSRAT
jgi:hypothetical protein